jgi:hypothetical protein
MSLAEIAAREREILEYNLFRLFFGLRERRCFQKKGEEEEDGASLCCIPVVA